MRIIEVDERDSHWEDDEPRFRVYLHDSGDDATGGATATYDVVGADALQVVDWAQRRAAPAQTYAVALVRDDDRRGLVWLVGCDGNDVPSDPFRADAQRRMLLRRRHPVGVPEADRAYDDLTAPHLDRSALLVIDAQVDFLDGGAAAVAGTSAVLPALARLVGAYRAAGRPVVHVVRLYAGDDVDLVRRGAVRAGADLVAPGSVGSQIDPTLLPDPAVTLDADLLLAGGVQRLGPDEVVVWKPRWSAFHRTPLDDLLSSWDVDTVVVAGCNLPNCPRATVFDASERDYRVVLVEDATSQTTPDRLADLALLGVHAWGVDEVARELAP